MSDEIKNIHRLSVPASVADFLMDHYGFFDVVEANMLSLYILKTLAHMENDGFKLSVFKISKDESGKDVPEAYGVDIHELITKFRIGLAGAMNEKKEYNPDIKIEHKEGDDESNKV